MRVSETILLALDFGVLSQNRLAQLAGVPQSTISRFAMSGRIGLHRAEALHAALLHHLGEALSVADGADHADAVAFLERVRGKWGEAAALRLQADARAAFEIQADVAEEVG